MARNLTPYDTGHRLEPQVWPAVDPDGVLDPERYGRVDFDDDESATVLAAYITCEDPAARPRSYELHVEPVQDLAEAGPSILDEATGEPLQDELLITVDGAPALVIREEQRASLGELISLAERGREDFLAMAACGDYSEEDIAEADVRWKGVTALIERVEKLVGKS